MKRNDSSRKVDARFPWLLTMYVFICLFFSQKLVIGELQFREVWLIQGLMFIKEMVNFRVTQKDSTFLGEVIDINVSTLKCPEPSRKHLHACGLSTERWRRRIIWKLLCQIDKIYLIMCKYLPPRGTLKTLCIGLIFISSLGWMPRLIFPNIGTYIFTCSK